MTTVPVTAAYPAREDRPAPVWGRVSWGPIMMGAVTAIGLQFIFTILGIAFGVTAADTTGGADPATIRTVGVVAGLWWLITGSVALAAGGFVFGRLSGLGLALPLKLEAVVMWGVVALFGFMVIWSGAGMLSQVSSPMGAMSSHATDASSRQAGHGEVSERGMTTANASPLDDFTLTRAEEARQATRTASWWSVIGLLVGVGAAIGGAHAGASAGLNCRDTSRLIGT